MGTQSVTIHEYTCDKCGRKSLQENGAKPVGWDEQEVRVVWSTCSPTTSIPGVRLFKGILCGYCLDEVRAIIYNMKLW